MPNSLPTLDDLYTYGAPSRAFGTLTDAQRTAGIQASFDEAMTYFASRGNLPLLSWDNTTARMVCQIAAYDLMCMAGFNPNQGADANYVDRAAAARVWLSKVASGSVTPQVTFSTAKAVGSFPQVISKPQRGF